MNDYHIFVEAVKNHFSFLIKLGYAFEGDKQYGAETHVVYKNAAINREIRIIRESYISVRILRKCLFSFNRFGAWFDIAFLFDHFDSCHLADIQSNNQGKYGVKVEIIEEIIKLHAEFCHEHLMAILQGEKWINQIVKVRKLTYPKFKDWQPYRPQS